MVVGWDEMGMAIMFRFRFRFGRQLANEARRGSLCSFLRQHQRPKGKEKR